MQQALMAVLVALVIGCAPGESVQIVTVGSVARDDGTVGCYLMGPTGRLVTDPVYGTAFLEDWPAGSGQPSPGWSPEPQGVAWPEGYTARWAGSEVEVLDPSGHPVAKTGRRYEIAPPGSIWELSIPDGFTGYIGVGECITPR